MSHVPLGLLHTFSHRELLTVRVCWKQNFVITTL